jgi:ParB family transcriptional regulator, chromosome partitioning protein
MARWKPIRAYRAHRDMRLTKETQEGAEDASPGVRSELTKAAENYLALHRHAIVGAELLAHSAIALRLAATRMIAGSPLWSVKPDPQRSEKGAIAESVARSPAQAALDAERGSVLELLQLEKSFCGTLARSNGDGHARADLFARLVGLSDETVLRLIALVMAETLAAGSKLVAAAGMVIKPDVARWWRLDDTLLDLLKDRTAINALLSEVAGKAVALSEPGKTRRRSSDCLKGEGREQVAGFVPRYMAFPVRHYDPTKTLHIAEDCQAVKPLFPGEKGLAIRARSLAPRPNSRVYESQKSQSDATKFCRLRLARLAL